MRLSEPVNICLEPIGTVVSTRSETTDDYWDKEQLSLIHISEPTRPY